MSEGCRSLDKQEEGESRSKDLSVQEGCGDVKEFWRRSKAVEGFKRERWNVQINAAVDQWS